jgi:hypothetical protein
MTARTVAIRFADDIGVADVAESLSAVQGDGRHLWLAGDETISIERTVLSPTGDGFVDHVSVSVADFLPLPEPPQPDGTHLEIDIEGIDRHGGYLWFVGSHSRTRRWVRPHHATEQALARLAKVSNNANRHLIGRIPVIEIDGAPTLVSSAPAASSPTGAPLWAAALGLSKRNRLTRALRDDEHLGDFLTIPSKDNGLDVEGLAIVGERIYLGLRGPVLRGWAVVLELRLVEGEDHDLLLAPVDGATTDGDGDGGRRYRKHFLDLGGLGVRDLLVHGDDLLVLAGPTMDLDGPARVHRWRDAARAETSVVVTDEMIERVLDLPVGEGDDHPEGIALLPGDPSSLLVVHDSPAPRRRWHQHEIRADIVALPAG